MALRINNNIPSQTALRNLTITDEAQSRTLERLSSGLRINRASDDPSGLVISEQLRSQISSLRKAVENASFAKNMISTGEAALNEVNSLLIQIRESVIFSLNTGGASVEQISAEQDSVDQAIEAIDRIAATTRFASRNLLNGESGFNIRSQASAIIDLRPISVQFDMRTSQTTYNLNVTTSAEQARLLAVASGQTTVASGGPINLRLTGNLGTEEISLPSGASVGQLRDAINILRGNTGVYASGTNLYSEEFGEDAMIRLELIGGTGDYSGAGGLTSSGQFTDDYGVDAEVYLNGSPGRSVGNELTFVSPFFTGSIELKPLTTTGTYDFTIRPSGLMFQLSNRGVPTDQATIGIPSTYTSELGLATRTTGGITTGGTLKSVVSGSTNDLQNDPANALTIIDAAIDQISDIRAFLGAFVNDNVEPAIRELGVHIENLQASESDIRDLDFASETANLTRHQILFQAGVSVVAQANAIPQSVIQLLNG